MAPDEIPRVIEGSGCPGLRGAWEVINFVSYGMAKSPSIVKYLVATVANLTVLIPFLGPAPLWRIQAK